MAKSWVDRSSRSAVGADRSTRSTRSISGSSCCCSGIQLTHTRDALQQYKRVKYPSKRNIRSCRKLSTFGPLLDSGGGRSWSETNYCTLEVLEASSNFIYSTLSSHACYSCQPAAAMDGHNDISHDSRSPTSLYGMDQLVLACRSNFVISRRKLRHRLAPNRAPLPWKRHAPIPARGRVK